MINKKKDIRLGILWADPYCGNLGVAALAYSTAILFENVAKQTGLKFHYTFWGASRCGNDTINVIQKEIPIRSVRPFLGGNIQTFAKRCIQNPRRIGTPIFALDFLRYNLIADISAGDSYSDIYGIDRFRDMDFTKKWAHFLNKTYILLPQTLGPFYSEEARKKAAKSLSNAQFVFARDEISYNCSQELTKSKIEKTIDVAFFLPFLQSKDHCEKIKVGVNISGLLWEGGYTQNNQFELKVDYRSTVIKILKFFTDKKDVELHLIAHVIGDPNSIDEDTHVIESLHNHFPNTIIAPKFKTPIEAKSYISNMDFFTGARMHACIAAISSGCPVYPLSYSRKFNGLFCETLGYKMLGDLKNQSEREILTGLQSAFENREILKQEIAQIIHRRINPEKDRLIEILSKFIVTI